MSSVKLNKKSLLERLQAKITLRLGKKISQQEILDKSIEFAYNRLDEFISEKIVSPRLTDELIEKIVKNSYKGELAFPEKSDDELIYGL
ncbi:MAG: hypothetical protein EU532_07310 [Promethearchaeota archaeon]|nr:MAG: hypothetical protein EU532_07310 [Candidatus Lokiarchaeota archaeon]